MIEAYILSNEKWIHNEIQRKVTFTDSLTLNLMSCRVILHCESGDASGVSVAHAMTKMPLLIACYAPEDAYNMDEIGLFYHAQPNKTLAHGKVHGHKI